MLNGTPTRGKDTEGSLNILTLYILKFPQKNIKSKLFLVIFNIHNEDINLI